MFFARVNHDTGNMSDADFAAYCKEHALASELLSSGDSGSPVILSEIKTVWLDTDPAVCLERLQRRGRAEENKVTLEYLQLLDTHRPHTVDLTLDTNAIGPDAVADAIEKHILEEWIGI